MSPTAAFALGMLFAWLMSGSALYCLRSLVAKWVMRSLVDQLVEALATWPAPVRANLFASLAKHYCFGCGEQIKGPHVHDLWDDDGDDGDGATAPGA